MTLFDVPPPPDAPLPGPGGRPFTEEQSAAIRRRTGGLLLSAGAGSGKTSVLVERLALLAAEDAVPLGSILAITFTEKAAGELRARVRARLAALGRPDLVAGEGAQVSTIHGFCAGVLRANAVAAGLDPAFRVLDEREARGLREAALETALAAFLNGPDAGHRAAALDVVAAYGVDRIAALVRGVHDEQRSRGEQVGLPVQPGPAPAAPASEDLARAARAALACLEGVAGKRVAEAAAKLRVLLEVLDAGRAPAPRELDAAVFAAGAAKALGEAPCTAYLDALAAHRTALLDGRARATLVLLDELVRGYAAAYAEAKARAGGVDFDDLELRTRDLLRDVPGVAEGLRRRFARVMVDEFQDTNPLQVELLGHLGEEVFEVGDERQSIYGFRHADVAVFRARRADREAQGAALGLATNFRSAPELLETVNALFAPTGWAALRPGRPEPRPLPGPRVELHLTTTAGWEDAGLQGALPDGQAWRHAEARHVARRVRELVDTTHLRAKDVVVLLRAATAMETFERALADEGLDTLAAGAAGWWARRQVLDLCAYLAALANPRDEEALFAFLASPLVSLSADGLAAVAAARPPGRRHELLERREGGSHLPDMPAPDAARLAEVAPWFAQEREGAARRGLDELLERAVLARGYDLHVLALPGGRRRLANVLKLQRLAAQAQRRLGRDVRAFIDLARAELDAGAKETDAPVDLGDQDAVRLMTIHAAKGLEFPCVVVADLGRDARRSRPDVTLGAGGRVGLRLAALDLAGGADALDHAPLLEELHLAEHEEERRVQYVAMTRAEELLVLSGAVDPARWPEDRPGAPPVGWIAKGLVPDVVARLAEDAAEHEETAERGGHVARVRLVRNAPGDHPLAPPAPPEPPQLELHLPDAVVQAPDVLPAVAPAPPGGVATLSYSSLSAYAACPYRWYLQRVLRLPRDERDVELAAQLAAEDPAAPPAAATGGFDALFRGSLVHRLLEELDPRATAPPAAEAVRRAAADEEVELTDAEVDDVRGLVQAYLDSPVRRRVAAAPWTGRERAFAFALGEHEPLVNGVLDLVAREADGGWLVVDYKTDAVAPDDDLEGEVERRYGVQRRIYALAALHAGAPRVEVVHLYLARPDAPVTATYGAQDRPALEADLREVASGLLGGHFAPAPDPHRGLCLTCPGRRALCSHEEPATLRPPPPPGPSGRRSAGPSAAG